MYNSSPGGLPALLGRPVSAMYVDGNHLLYGTVLMRPRGSAWLSRRLSALYDVAAPTDLVYIALDGAAPLAKLRTQRARRELKLRRARLDRRHERHLADLALTPGTPQMEAIKGVFWRWAVLRLLRHPRLRVRVSAHDVPGEGERKAFVHMKQQSRREGGREGGRGEDPEKGGAIVVCANDADVALFALLRPTPRPLHLLRPAAGDSLEWVDVDALRSLVEREAPVADFVLLSLLCGSDFLPKLRGASPKALLAAYAAARRDGADGIVDRADRAAPRLALDALAAVLERVPTRREPKSKKSKRRRGEAGGDEEEDVNDEGEEEENEEENEEKEENEEQQKKKESEEVKQVRLDLEADAYLMALKHNFRYLALTGTAPSPLRVTPPRVAEFAASLRRLDAARRRLEAADAPQDAPQDAQDLKDGVYQQKPNSGTLGRPGEEDAYGTPLAYLLALMPRQAPAWESNVGAFLAESVHSALPEWAEEGCERAFVRDVRAAAEGALRLAEERGLAADADVRRLGRFQEEVEFSRDPLPAPRKTKPRGGMPRHFTVPEMNLDRKLPRILREQGRLKIGKNTVIEMKHILD